MQCKDALTHVSRPLMYIYLIRQILCRVVAYIIIIIGEKVSFAMLDYLPNIFIYDRQTSHEKIAG